MGIDSKGMKNFTVAILLLLSLETFGQINIGGKYSRDDYPSSFIILTNDSTFKYQFNFDINWDLACGTYKLKKNLIIFSYTSDMYDTINCNTDRVNYLKDKDGKDEFVLGTTIDMRFRPDTLMISGPKLYQVDKGVVRVKGHYLKKEKTGRGK
jgi:hypothetical protein